MECEEVKAVVSVGCCYNLLSEEGFNHVGSQCGFPMSRGVKSACLSLGKSSRDLACQVRAYVGSLISFFLPRFLSLFLFVLFMEQHGNSERARFHFFVPKNNSSWVVGH